MNSPSSSEQTIAKLLQRYQQGDRNFREMDLSQANLSQLDLKGVDFSYADLTEANLCGTNLRGADLSYASLRGAKLANANLRGTIAIGTDFTGADLTDTNLELADYDETTRFPKGFVIGERR